MDPLLDFSDERFVLFFGELVFEIAEELSFRNVRFLSISDELCHFIELPHRFFVIRLDLARVDVCDEDDRFPVMVECDDLVKKHEVRIVEGNIRFLFLLEIEFLLRVPRVLIGEVSDKPAGKCWHARDFRRLVFVKDFPDDGGRVVCLKCFCDGALDGHLSVLHEELKLWIISQKGIASPSLGIVRAFEEECCPADFLQDSQCPDDSADICEDFLSDRNSSVVFRIGFDSFQLFHPVSPFRFRITKKTRPRQK